MSAADSSTTATAPYVTGSIGFTSNSSVDIHRIKRERSPEPARHADACESQAVPHKPIPSSRAIPAAIARIVSANEVRDIKRS